jgi:hypothetical protein
MNWTERYNCHSLRIGSGFAISVNWNAEKSRGEPGYEVIFMGTRLKNNVRSLTEAKQAGIALARKTLTEALNSLPS